MGTWLAQNPLVAPLIGAERGTVWLTFGFCWMRDSGRDAANAKEAERRRYQGGGGKVWPSRQLYGVLAVLAVLALSLSLGLGLSLR